MQKFSEVLHLIGGYILVKRFYSILCGLLCALLVIQSAVLPASALRVQITTHKSSYVDEDGNVINYHTPVYNKIPLFLQTDYPDTLYGSGTIESSGCSIVSLAMVATYLTGHTYMPDELADYFGGRAENNMARLECGSETLQLPYTKTWYFYEALEELKKGKIIIALVEETSIFTDSQHFIVLTGITEEGKILVNDPYSPNYERWDLKDGFANGFTEYQIMNGFSGAWIYDKEAMPEEPFIYKEEKPVKEETRYSDIELTAEETHLLARVVWVESRGECAEGQQAVAEIVLNRMKSELFPDTMNEVIYGEGQFRSVPYLEDAEPYQAQYDAIEAALYGPNILPEDVFYFATTPTNNNIWGKIGGHIFCYY